MSEHVFINIAVPSPLRRMFTYRLPNNCNPQDYQSGCRVQIPFGNRKLIGIIIENATNVQVAHNKIKPIDALIDTTPLWPDDLWELLMWSTRYYQHPIGEVLQTSLPAQLRQGRPAQFPKQKFWFLTEAGKTVSPEKLKRAPRQRDIIEFFNTPPGEISKVSDEQLRKTFNNANDALKRLQEKGLIDFDETDILFNAQHQPVAGPELNHEQQYAVDTIIAVQNEFSSFLVDGVTGSGKTEVYLQIIRTMIENGKQSLVLVPEIGLTPQMISRFQDRLGCRIAVLHSGLTDSERLHAWLSARRGDVPVILGTRSAIFTPMKNPGLIVIDEEHDASFKQQDGFRYSARDLAIWRAKYNNIPVVLGSATPSMESLHNVSQQRFTKIDLLKRAGDAKPPKLHLLDMRSQPMSEGLTDKLLQIARQHLDKNNQVLFFLNRRGFAPTIMCHDCGWTAHCQRCDSNMTFHQSDGRFRCHHCGAERPTEKSCPQCQSKELLTIGAGTERIESLLKEKFTDAEIIRIDRDTTRKRGSLQALLERVKNGQRQILIGTQMLAKGHHFPRVTLVGVIDADQGLHSAEFHAPERMAQLILQVAGRAGRAEQAGEVYIQTHHPDHPLLRALIENGYAEFAQQLLIEREQASLPPFTAMALFRAEAVKRDAPLNFLQQIRELALPYSQNGIQLFGPLPAPMEKRAGRFRAQLIVQAPQRQSLQGFLRPVLPLVDALKPGNKVRWSLDVDPLDTY